MQKQHSTPNFLSQIDPHNIQAEELIIGQVLTGASLLNTATDIISPEMFFTDFLGQIYGAAIRLENLGTPINTMSLTRSLETAGFRDIGNHQSVGSFVDHTYAELYARTFCSNPEDYTYAAELIRETWTRRSLIKTAREAIAAAQDMQKPVLDVCNAIQDSVGDAVSGHQTKTTLRNMGLVFNERALEFLDPEAIELSPAYSTGFPSLDNLSDGGLWCGELTLIAGASGIGKSGLAFQIAMNVALSTGKPIFIASMEMTARSVIDRWISSLSRVLLSKLRRREIDQQDMERILASMSFGDRLSNVCLDEDPSAPLNVMISRAKEHARKFKRKNGGDGQLALMVIDNLQIAETSNAENQTIAINSLCKKTKGIAKDLNVPIISLSQLTKESLKGADKRPTKEALSGGGGIVNNADTIWGLYRDEYYNKDTVERNIAEVIALKQRSSEDGRVAKLRYEGQYQTFSELGNVAGPKLANSEPKQAIAEEPDEYYYNKLKVGDSVVVNEGYSLFRNETTIADMIANKEIPPFGVICTITRLWTEEYLGSKMGGAALKTPDGVELHSSPDYLRLA